MRTPDNRVIAAQCCRIDLPQSATAGQRCKRFLKNAPDDCIAGKSYKDNNPPMTEFTYSAAKAECKRLSNPLDPLIGELDLCDESCDGQGCGYGKNPVITKLPCPSPPSTPPSPPAAPPPPPPRIPPGGVLVLEGNKDFQIAYCAVNGTDDDRVRTPDNRVIAAQCCRIDLPQSATAGQRCKRFLKNDPDDCIAGKSYKDNNPPLTEFTYSAAKAECKRLSNPLDP